MPLLCWAAGGCVFARFCPGNQPQAMVRCCALCPTAGLCNDRRRCLFSPRNILPEGAVACAWKRTRLGDGLCRSKDVHNGWVSGAVVVVVNQVEKRSLALSMCNMGSCYWYYC
jgi:hypothetical protein